MILINKPQFLSPAYNPLDMILDNEATFEAILSEFIIRTNTNDTVNGIKRLNIYNDDTVKYDLSELVKSFIERIRTNNTFSPSQLSVEDQVLTYLSIIDTNGTPPPFIIDWLYAFNGSFDRNEFLDYIAETLLNKPLLNNKQIFIPTQYGHCNIFDGQYTETDRHNYEYINFQTDKLNDNPLNNIYSADDVSSTTTNIELYDGYLYNHQMATAIVNDKYVIANSNQPNGKNGWRVPSREDWFELRDTLDPSSPGGIPGNNNNNAGASLKLNTLWSANAGTNESKFSALPSGFLLNNIFVNNATYFGGATGAPLTANSTARFMTTTEVDADNIWYAILSSSNNHLNVFGENQGNKYFGYSIRLVRDAVEGDVDYDPEGYVGNNGYPYPTVKIGNQVWLASNLREFVFDTSETPPNLTNHKGSLSQWSDYATLGYGFTFYSSDSFTNTCATNVGFTFPCTVFGSPVVGRIVDYALVTDNIDNPNLITNKIYRYYNQVIENDILFPTAVLRTTNGNTNLFDIKTGRSKMISTPCYPANINLSNNTGYVMEVASKLTIQVKDASRYNVGDALFIRFKQLTTNTVEKLRHLNVTRVIESIDTVNNIITFTYTLVDISNWSEENFTCIVFNEYESVLLRPKRSVIEGKFKVVTHTVDGEEQDVLSLVIDNEYNNNLTNYSIIHLLSNNSTLKSLLDSLKFVIYGRRTSGDGTIELFLRTKAEGALVTYINNNLTTVFEFVINDEIVYEDMDFTKDYIMYTSELFVNEDVSNENMYQRILSDDTNFTLFEDCSKFDIVQLGYINQYGGVEYLLFNKKRVDEREISRLSMRKSLRIGDRTKQDEELYNYNQTVDYNGVISSGWLDEDYYNRCLELIESTKVFEVKDGYELPIVIRNTNVIERNKLNDKLFNIDIEYTRTYNKLIQR